MRAFVYCRNCVAWREPLYPEEIDACKGNDCRICRVAHNSAFRKLPDDGCCDGVAKRAALVPQSKSEVIR